jgi:cell division protein ZipA
MWTKPCAWLQCKALILAAELRFILAALSVLLLAGIWWWGARRSRQAAGNAELRESTMSSSTAPVRTAAPVVDEPDPAEPRGHESRDWGVPPLEPLSIRTAQFESVQLTDLSMTAHADPLDETLDLGIADHERTAQQFAPPPAERAEDPEPVSGADEPSTSAARVSSAGVAEAPWTSAARAPSAGVAEAPSTSAARAPSESVADALPAAPKPQLANASETQRIVSIRVSAVGDTRWSGVDLMVALENHGLAHGRYNVFHRKHSDGRTLFCAASLVEPGVFNLANMPQEEFRGLTLFAVLPGPLPPLQTLDAVVETAGELAAALHGTLQDSHGAPLSMQRAEALREDVARFQAQLTMT